eukprot:Skav232419  [mRNA]  locus=scaffold189:55887:57457:- [translate_table: standard]
MQKGTGKRVSLYEKQREWEASALERQSTSHREEPWFQSRKRYPDEISKRLRSNACGAPVRKLNRRSARSAGAGGSGWVAGGDRWMGSQDM